MKLKSNVHHMWDGFAQRFNVLTEEQLLESACYAKQPTCDTLGTAPRLVVYYQPLRNMHHRNRQ